MAFQLFTQGDLNTDMLKWFAFYSKKLLHCYFRWIRFIKIAFWIITKKGEYWACIMESTLQSDLVNCLRVSMKEPALEPESNLTPLNAVSRKSFAASLPQAFNRAKLVNAADGFCLPFPSCWNQSLIWRPIKYRYRALRLGQPALPSSREHIIYCEMCH